MILFSGSLSQGILNQEQVIRSEILNIKNIPENLEEIKKSLYERFVINSIIFDENIEQKDVKRYEISQNIMATFGMIVNKEQRISIKYHINFTGDKELFFLGGNTVVPVLQLNIENYKVEKNYIEIEHNWIDLAKDVNNQKKQIDSQNKQFLECLKTNINYQKSDIEYFNNNLNNLIEKTLDQSIAKLKKANDVFLAFGGKIEEKKPESIDQKTILNQNTKEQTEVKKETINKEPLHKEIAKKGGIERHKTTNTIKNEIIKPMFLFIQKDGISKGRKYNVSEIANKIVNQLNEYTQEKLIQMYQFKDKTTLEKAIKYCKEKAGGEIDNWCYKINKKEL